ncbi:MAG: PfkB family carbohydrate kinase [Syntrophomonadaceae bacterium]|nr:PfkB family carbohydrate kinase [Syntrophomonadaceae bacterium]MDD3271720.1 PfkB family carbohydrate kinase [Syntrophomonadaceae bacterium]MDD4562145.1 PfkB family carbohydrate kinase [Syntrophomonadaceae bacterium]
MRLTLREREIFEVLKKEPLISQDELARRFGITRSSIAVHISNLMKKGVILGKGYVINEAASAVVVGESCINIDVQGEDENTVINVDFGGFAVEFSRVLSNLGVNVKVITVTGNDNISDAIISKLREREIDTSSIYRHARKRSCRRISINNVSTYEECYSWNDYQKAVSLSEWVVLNCEWLCVDPQFQEKMIKKLSGKEDEKLPYLSTYRIMQSPEDIPEYLWNYSTVVLGVKSDSLDWYAQKVRALSEHQNWILTDGSSRVIYFQDKKATDVLLLPNQIFTIENRLPFLLAGLIYGLSSGYPLRQAIRISIGAAAGE